MSGLHPAVKRFIMILMKMSSRPAAKRLGRPLSFDREKALHAATLQFWRTGYETTSVADLIHAMGITAPSLYAAFGDKESLFLECLEKYADAGPKSTPELIADAPSARQAAQHLLEASARWFTQKDAPSGCLVASAASSGSSHSQRVRVALKKVREANRKALQKRAERDVREGRLPRTGNPQALASLTMAVIQGMSTLARDGAGRKTLLDLAKAAMTAWPMADSPQTLSLHQRPTANLIARATSRTAKPLRSTPSDKCCAQRPPNHPPTAKPTAMNNASFRSTCPALR